jgi:hypothetical protein
MSNTIRLTSTHGDVRWGKSFTYDGQLLADKTDVAWIAHDIDWPDRNDYPRWFLPRNTEQPTREWIGSVRMLPDGTVQFPGPLSDEQLEAVMEAGAVVSTEVATRLYSEEDGSVLHAQFADWSS